MNQALWRLVVVCLTILGVATLPNLIGHTIVRFVHWLKDRRCKPESVV